jgi:hypothetical protein
VAQLVLAGRDRQQFKTNDLRGAESARAGLLTPSSRSLLHY